MNEGVDGCFSPIYEPCDKLVTCPGPCTFADDAEIEVAGGMNVKG